MNNIQNKPLVGTLVGIIVVLIIVIIGISSTKNTVNNSGASDVQDTAQINTSVTKTPSTGTVSTKPSTGISYLRGQATATLRCMATSTGRCQTGTGYAQFGVKVYQNSVLIQATKLATDGSFEMRLPPGTYVVFPDWYTPGIAVTDAWTTDLPKPATLKAGVMTTIPFTINYTQY